MSELPSSVSAARTDSLAVLDALLKLTNSSLDGPDSSSRSREPPPISNNLNRFQCDFPGYVPPFSPAAATTALLASSGLAIHPNLLGTAAIAAGMLLPTMSSNQHQFNFSPSQLTAAVSLLSSASPSTSEYNTGGQQNAAPSMCNNDATNSPSIPIPDASGDGVPAVNVLSSNSKASGVLPALSSPVAALKEANTQNNVVDALLRQEKVVEALKSKPQRGKRRDDLSETERMELTRTRNREHAKSTR
jgi:hypothetical protein